MEWVFGEGVGLGKDVGGFARGWRGRERLRRLLCKGVQRCARVGGHQSGEKMERGRWERSWRGLHGAGGAGKGCGGSCARVCKGVRGLAGTRMASRPSGGIKRIRGGHWISRAKACKGWWAPEVDGGAGGAQEGALVQGLVHKNESKGEKEQRGGAWEALHVAGGAREGSGGSCARACKRA